MTSWRIAGWWWLPLLSIVAVLIVWHMLPRIWHACDMDPNGDPAAGLGLLLFYLPAALVGTAAGCGIVYRVLAPRSLGFALAASAAAMVLIVWAILVWGRGDAAVAAGLCPTGDPSWWPWFVPL